MILVLSTYRTGSTNLCKSLAEERGYENLDECFHESLIDQHKDVLRYILKNPNCVIKIFPYHLEKSNIDNLFNQLVEIAEQVIILIRKDFDSQVKSYYTCKQIGDWHSDFEDTVDILLDKDKFLWCTNFLHNQYLEISNLKHKLSDYKLLYTHQLDQKNKYQRPTKWNRQPGFTNIDIEELFV